jgi:hypothetical protein
MIDDRILQKPFQVELIGVKFAQKLFVCLPNFLRIVAGVVHGLPFPHVVMMTIMVTAVVTAVVTVIMTAFVTPVVAGFSL